MAPRAFIILPLVGLLLLLPPAATARADIDVGTPLGSYYQPGRYFPVRVRLTGGAAADVTIRAEGAVPTVISADVLSGGNSMIVPFLPVTGAATRLEVAAAGHETRALPLTRVPEGERLVAVTGDEADLAFARRLFPGKRVLPVVGADPTTGPAIAWDAVDGAVLDHLLDPQRVTALLATGMTLALPGSDPPQDGWPWRLDGSYWVLRRDWAGPRGAVVPEAYDPPQMWHPGRPVGVRRGAVFASVIFALLVLAASLLRPCRGLIGIVAVSVTAGAIAIAWHGRLSPVVEAGGAVICTTDSVSQRDDWIYRRHLEPADGALAGPSADVLLKPAFAAARQVDRSGILLRVGRDGTPPQFVYHLEPSWTLAFRATRIVPGRWPGDPANPVTTPLRELSGAYLANGRTIEGELAEPRPAAGFPPGTERWGALLIGPPEAAK